MINLYLRLVDLGMEYRDGKVYLADLEELNPPKSLKPDTSGQGAT